MQGKRFVRYPGFAAQFDIKPAWDKQSKVNAMED